VRSALRKLESAEIKLSTSIEGKDASAYQRASEIVLLHNKIRRLNADVTILTKKMDGQLQLKLQEAAQEKSHLALEKEKFRLQRDEGKKRKKKEMIELEHSEKVKLHDHRFKLSTTAAHKKTRDKSREQK
jgi:hypothetical protein